VSAAEVLTNTSTNATVARCWLGPSLWRLARAIWEICERLARQKHSRQLCRSKQLAAQGRWERSTTLVGEPQGSLSRPAWGAFETMLASGFAFVLHSMVPAQCIAFTVIGSGLIGSGFETR
jgi:hypothetical protein